MSLTPSALANASILSGSLEPSLNGIPSSTENGAVSSSSGQFLAATQSGPSTSIFFSSNYGASWIQTSAPTANWDSIAMSANGTQIIATQSLGGIWIGTLT